MQDRIKVVIVDDEPQSIHRLQDDLATLEDFEVIATSSSAVSAKNLVMSIQPDVLFIDVEMPGQTGFEVLQSLRDEIPMELIVVFYSAFDKYMIDALRASAFDFLLKPYQQDEFELVVDRIRQKMKDEDASSVPESSSCSSESVLASQKAQDFSGMNGMLGTRLQQKTCQDFYGRCRFISVGRTFSGNFYNAKPRMDIAFDWFDLCYGNSKCDASSYFL